MINPIAFSIGPFSIHWYGIMYALTFIICYLILHYTVIGKKLHLTENKIDTFLIYIILGIIIGGRLGYIFFYNLSYYLQNPLKMLYIWEGGLSFHGGLIAIIIGLIIFSKVHKIPFLKLSDLTTLLAPVGIFFVRIGNFINGELYGRRSDNFCLNFHTDPQNCRYPSQIFESLSEGVLLFLILIFIYKKSPQPGIISALFLILYGTFRILVENFREPDPQIGFIFGQLTLGQLLSLLMLIAGTGLLFRLKKSYNRTIKHKP